MLRAMNCAFCVIKSAYSKFAAMAGLSFATPFGIFAAAIFLAVKAELAG
jgi:hypothetical protein